MSNYYSTFLFAYSRQKKVDDLITQFLEIIYDISKVELDKVEEQNDKRVEEGGMSKDGQKPMNDDELQDVIWHFQGLY